MKDKAVDLKSLSDFELAIGFLRAKASDDRALVEFKQSIAPRIEPSASTGRWQSLTQHMILPAQFCMSVFMVASPAMRIVFTAVGSAAAAIGLTSLGVTEVRQQRTRRHEARVRVSPRTLIERADTLAALSEIHDYADELVSRRGFEVQSTKASEQILEMDALARSIVLEEAATFGHQAGRAKKTLAFEPILAGPDFV